MPARADADPGNAIRVEDHLGLARFWAAKWYKGKRGGLLDTDEYADACLGLMEAVKRYDPNYVSPKTGQRVKFSTYATWWIRQAIQKGHAERFGERNSGKQRAREGLFSDLAKDTGGKRELRVEDEIAAPVDPEQAEMESPLQRMWHLLDLVADERERRILFKRLMGRTLEEVGEDEGICKERARQLEVRALTIIRKAIEERAANGDGSTHDQLS